MGRTLKKGDTGDDVGRLQVDLLRMLGVRQVHFAKPNRYFGPKTEAAVRMLQQKLQLRKDPPGVAGPEVQRALEYHVIDICEGSIGLKCHLCGDRLELDQLHNRVRLLDDKLKLESTPGKRSPSKPTSSEPSPEPKPAPVKDDDNGGWLVQFQPTLGPGMLTPPPFFFKDPQHGPTPGMVYSSGFSLGLIYRTRKEGRHWEVTPPGTSWGFFINSQNTPSDPKYTLQIPTSVTWADLVRADLFGRDDFHLAVLAQLTAILNMEPRSIAGQAAVGPQVSVDIIDDKLNIFLQANLAAQYNFTNGQFQFGSGLLLGATLQWGAK
jgi:Putative peptidoglycan binding domain